MEFEHQCIRFIADASRDNSNLCAAHYLPFLTTKEAVALMEQYAD